MMEEAALPIHKYHVVTPKEKEKIDITAPSTKITRGSKHPINRVIEEIQDIFVFAILSFVPNE